MELDSGFKDRLRWAINVKETNQSALARELGISAQGVQQWVSGATSNPKRELPVKACDFLGCRYEWLAYGRGPMKASETVNAPAPANAPETVLLAHEFDAAVQAALPPEQLGNWKHKVGHPSGRAQLHVDWISDQLIAEVGLYKDPANLVLNARQHLWMITMLREILPPVAGRRAMLVLAPVESWRDVPERHIEALQSEARLMNIELIHVKTPDQVAAALAGQEQEFNLPEDEDLGLDVSPLL